MPPSSRSSKGRDLNQCRSRPDAHDANILALSRREGNTGADMQNFKERYTYFTETLSGIYTCAYKKIEMLDAGLEDFVLEQFHSTTHFCTAAHFLTHVPPRLLFEI